MIDVAAVHAGLAARIAAVPFNPFRGSGQGVRQPYPDHFEAVQFSSADGIPLAGRLALHRDGRPHPAIVMSHGTWFFKEVDALVDLAQFYFSSGWSVFVFDFQGHGESAKLSDAPYTMGWKESDNILGAAAYLRGLGKSVGSIAIEGCSLAGAAALLAADRAVGLVDCLVIGSPPARQEPHFIMSHIDKWLRIAKVGPIEYFDRVGAYYGISGEQVRRLDETVEATRSVKIPTLFIQTAEDDFIPSPDQAQLEAAARSNPNVLCVAQARGGHGVEIFLNDRYWWKAVTSAYLKAFQASSLAYVSDQPSPPLDVQLTIATGWENLLLVSIWLRNSGQNPLGDVAIQVALLDEPAPEYLAAPPMFSPAERDGRVLTWRAAWLPGNGDLVGPFTVALPVTAIPAGTRLRTRVEASWTSPEPGTTVSNEASYSQR